MMSNSNKIPSGTTVQMCEETKVLFRNNSKNTSDEHEINDGSEDNSSPLHSAHECQSKDEELDEAAIIKNHLDPVPFPEPAFDQARPFRYILWSENNSPIKVFKETAV
ncbi:Acyl-CoA (8-3)-desaturase [Frankliniella fusca]|uniref:Acyl-CoA (8-3)-desaturase n=1 Tax=Frankliniella fusca TaxID=407009 RepID=A0AAE1HHB7_9NEOP|nr:Acyl-CoA (8-3)-desaturase [Frankliniella fusca]